MALRLALARSSAAAGRAWLERARMERSLKGFSAIVHSFWGCGVYTGGSMRFSRRVGAPVACVRPKGSIPSITGIPRPFRVYRGNKCWAIEFRESHGPSCSNASICLATNG